MVCLSSPGVPPRSFPMVGAADLAGVREIPPCFVADASRQHVFVFHVTCNVRYRCKYVLFTRKSIGLLFYFNVNTFVPLVILFTFKFAFPQSSKGLSKLDFLPG